MSSPTLTAWALGPSEPPTSASDGGLFATETASRSPTAKSNEHCERNVRGNPSLLGAARSLTPVKNDAEQSGSAARGPSLTSQARAARSPTPTANEGGKGVRGGKRGNELLLGGAIRQQARGAETAMSGSTPARRYSSTAPRGAAQDSGNVTLPPSQAVRDTLPGDLIRLNNEAGPSPCSPDSSSESGSSRGSISAAWETQYMGYPDGWLDISTGAASWLSGTLSCRKSFARSQRASSKREGANSC